jgi:hypothetical protein
MMSMDSIRSLASKHAARAKRLGIKPLVITESILARLKAGNKKIPFLGDYVPKGFYLIKEVFVDSSGFGGSHEPAMTGDRFIESLEIGKAYAVREMGEFQCFVGVYGVNGKGPTDEQLEKFSEALGKDESRRLAGSWTKIGK